MTNIQAAKKWRPLSFFLCYFVTAFLAFSLLWAPLSDIWRAIDETAFFLLNGTLEWGGGWTFIWGHLNTRPFDVTWAVVMGLPLVWMLLRDSDEHMERRFAKVLLVVVAVLLGILVAKTGFKNIDRISPSGVLTPFIDVNTLLPGISAKTGSNSSFPGDHGVAALIYAITIIFIFKRPTLSAIAIFIAVMNTAPRLIGGGHWLSDVVVGGLGIALFVVPLVLATPAVEWAEKVMAPFVQKIARPLFKKIGLGDFTN